MSISNYINMRHTFKLTKLISTINHYGTTLKTKYLAMLILDNVSFSKDSMSRFHVSFASNNRKKK